MIIITYYPTVPVLGEGTLIIDHLGVLMILYTIEMILLKKKEIRSSNFQPLSWQNSKKNYFFFQSCCNQICQTFCPTCVCMYILKKAKKISDNITFVPQKPPYNTTKEELKPRIPLGDKYLSHQHSFRLHQRSRFLYKKMTQRLISLSPPFFE